MRFVGALIVGFSLALLLPGCGTSPSSKQADEKAAKEKSRDATGSAIDTATANRDAYAREMTARVAELDAKYEDLKTRAAEASGQAKRELQKKLDRARGKRDACIEQLADLEGAKADHWEMFKDGMSQAVDDLKKSFD